MSNSIKLNNFNPENLKFSKKQTQESSTYFRIKYNNNKLIFNVPHIQYDSYTTNDKTIYILKFNLSKKHDETIHLIDQINKTIINFIATKKPNVFKVKSLCARMAT